MKKTISKQKSPLKANGSSQYDKVIKEALRRSLPVLMTEILGLPAGNFEPVHLELQRTVERKADFIGTLYSLGQHRTIAHTEVQAKDDPRMVFREYLYSALILSDYPDWDLIQTVFFIGKSKPKMPSSLKKSGLEYSFRLVWVKDISYKKFLATGIPEVMLLGILAGFDGKPPHSVMEEIVNQVKQSTPSILDFRRHVEQLHILSNLHNLQQIFEQIMLNISELIDERKDPFFQRGIAEGVEQGIEQGIEQGRLEDAERMLRKGFEPDVVANVLEIGLDVVVKLQQKILEDK